MENLKAKAQNAALEYEGLEDATADYVEMYWEDYNQELQKAFIAGAAWYKREVGKNLNTQNFCTPMTLVKTFNKFYNKK